MLAGGDADGGREVRAVTRSADQFIGGLLITQGGQYVGEPELFIVHWDGVHFTTRGIPLSHYYGARYANIDEIEGAVFAPIDIHPLH